MQPVAERAATRRVLIVDASDETREVLRILLQRRGLETMESRAARAGLHLATSCQPDLVVLDLESVPPEETGLFEQFARQSHGTQTSLVVLGQLPRNPQPDGPCCVAKPYHYGPLIRKIESLLRLSTADAREESSGTIPKPIEL